MMKKVIVVGFCVVFLATATLAFAETVYVTKQGKKYHKADCLLIKSKGPQPIALEEAVKKGLEPCQKCYKDEVSLKKTDEAKALNVVKKQK